MVSVLLPEGGLGVRVDLEIAEALKTCESSLFEELEKTTRKSVIIQSDKFCNGSGATCTLLRPQASCFVS